MTNRFPKSYDIIGSKEKSVAIVEIPKKSNKRKIADFIMEQNKNVKSVLEKSSPRKGKYRTRKLKWISGSRNTEVVHIESGCRFLLDPRKVYFSQREGTERLRVASMVRKNETVMVFFAGVGPFAIIIAKKSFAKNVIGIEINPDAVKYFKKNILLNKLENVKSILGDVKEKSKPFYKKCDRVIMPLPETSVDFLDNAKKCLKKNGVINFYFFSEEKKLNEWKKKLNKNFKIKKIQKVLPYGPCIWKYRIDLVEKK